MTAFSDYAENALINHLLRNSALSSPATVYLALYTTNPTDADSGAEVSGGSYERKSIAFDAPSNGVTQNTSQVSFPVATGTWGTVTHWAIADASSGGNILFHGSLTTPQEIISGRQIVFGAGQVTITLS